MTAYEKAVLAALEQASRDVGGLVTVDEVCSWMATSPKSPRSVTAGLQRLEHLGHAASGFDGKLWGPS